MAGFGRDPWGLYEIKRKGDGSKDITLIIVSDHTVFRDAAKHLNEHKGNVIVVSDVCDSSDMIKAIKELIKEGITVKEFGISGHGYGAAGVQTKAGNKKVKQADGTEKSDPKKHISLYNLTPAEDKVFLSILSDKPRFSSYGCCAGKGTRREKALQDIATWINGYARGWTRNVTAGPNGTKMGRIEELVFYWQNVPTEYYDPGEWTEKRAKGIPKKKKSNNKPTAEKVDKK